MELSDKRIWLYGLLVACPEVESLCDCPFEKYRKLTLEERLKTVEELSEEEVDEIIKHHNQCLLRRV